MADNETIADIIAEMRDYSNDCNDGYHTDYGVVCTDIRNYADRLEAAWKREKTAIEANALAVGGIVEASRAAAEKSSTVGDCAKLREAISALRTALKDIRDDVLDMVMNHKNENPDSYAHGLCLSIGGACDMALNSTKEYDNANK